MLCGGMICMLRLTPKTRGDYAVFMSDSQNTGQTTAAASLGTIVV
jgi:hypothetical protein